MQLQIRHHGDVIPGLIDFAESVSIQKRPHPARYADTFLSIGSGYPIGGIMWYAGVKLRS